ncbi:hypothetical protein ACLOJK_019563 [Asimina triloba]
MAKPSIHCSELAGSRSTATAEPRHKIRVKAPDTETRVPNNLPLPHMVLIPSCSSLTMIESKYVTIGTMFRTEACSVLEMWYKDADNKFCVKVTLQI